ncbi:MAG: FAD-binding oxidoreductase [Rhodospirillales bacterium]|jgi:glycine/D-amino acid oxidase-like deaminating enzyme|nr:FAD-binding oxidoreductase [Rhodospirillales bacterium]HJO97720.1 FAD-binding oxidoreductase [Rhodospirillales bacterium]
MTSTTGFDVAVVGGGVMGCTIALHLARGGMRVAVLERHGLCTQASGINAGTLSMQHPPHPALVPYALGGRDLWRTSGDWLGAEIGFRERGGLVLAFTDEEAEALETRMAERKAAGSPIEVVSAGRAREIEPGLSKHPILASYCALDGFANSSLIGSAFRTALNGASAEVHERSPVTAIEKTGDGFAIHAAGSVGSVIQARRVVLATGVWSAQPLKWLGLAGPIGFVSNQMAVSERMGRVVSRMLGVVAGNLSLKQVDNGTVLIGGGWQGLGHPEKEGTAILRHNLIGNLRMARHAVPALGDVRIVRTWLGYRDDTPDRLPLVGPLPGVEGAFLIVGVRDGFTVGPFMGKVLADFMLGREPEQPLFDPARLVVAVPS